jgi:GSH-dependent disulfide-bond oxidoreductase
VLRRPAPRKRVAPGQAASRKRAASRTKQRPIELYFWPTSNGIKISIMLEECALSYEWKPININRVELFAPHFLAISPNHRISASVDPDGPEQKPIAIFESGATLQYLGRKTATFYPKDERGRVEVDQWVFWQVGGLGPMAGQAHHFRGDAPEELPYAILRYTDEVNRLYGVMEKRLADRDYVVGDFTIADIACWGWSRNWKRQGQTPGTAQISRRGTNAALRGPASSAPRRSACICATPTIRLARIRSPARVFSVSALVRNS